MKWYTSLPHDIILCELISYDMIWYYSLSYVWYYINLYYMRWTDLIGCDMICQSTVRYDIPVYHIIYDDMMEHHRDSNSNIINAVYMNNILTEFISTRFNTRWFTVRYGTLYFSTVRKTFSLFLSSLLSSSSFHYLAKNNFFAVGRISQ